LNSYQIAILCLKHAEIVNECTRALRDNDLSAIRQALVDFYGVDPPAGDVECCAELLRLVRVSTPTRAELEAAGLSDR
jgi:hypothetical protein